MTGEAYKAQLEIRYATKPSVLIIGYARVVPFVERRWKFRIGWG